MIDCASVLGRRSAMKGSRGAETWRGCCAEATGSALIDQGARYASNYSSIDESSNSDEACATHDVGAKDVWLEHKEPLVRFARCFGRNVVWSKVVASASTAQTASETAYLLPANQSIAPALVQHSVAAIPDAALRSKVNACRIASCTFVTTRNRPNARDSCHLEA